MKKYGSIILSLLCILLIAGCSKKEQIVSDTPNVMVPSIIYEGSLYRTTGKQIPAEVDESAIVGEICSVVPLTQLPTKEGEANFGEIGDQYAITSDGLLVTMNNEWTLFEISETELSDGAPLAPSETDLDLESVSHIELMSGLTGQKITVKDAPPTEPGDEGNDELPDIEPADRTREETISFHDKTFNKSELCDATLHWLELSEQERMLSSYMPPEFMIFEETWGINLTAENITSISATIKCVQSGGEPTGELHTGSWFILESWTKENGWKEMPYVVEGDIAWTEEAWMITMDDVCEWDINWEYLYGAIPEGKYRIGKEIMDFRGLGDFDKTIYFAEFEIME